MATYAPHGRCKGCSVIPAPRIDAATLHASGFLSKTWPSLAMTSSIALLRKAVPAVIPRRCPEATADLWHLTRSSLCPGKAPPCPPHGEGSEVGKVGRPAAKGCPGVSSERTQIALPPI